MTANAGFYTYIHRKADTGEVFYVGKGMGYRHQDKNNRNKHWNNVVSKHGLVVEIVRQFEIEADALSHERELIGFYRSCGTVLSNYTDGGEGQSGISPSPETRAKLSAALKGGTWTDKQRNAFEASTHKRGPISDAHKEKISAAKKGVKPAVKKGPVSAEQKAKISATLKARYAIQTFSAEHLLAMSIAKSKARKPLSEAHRMAISAAKSGIKKQPFTEEHKANMSLARVEYFRSKKEFEASD